MKLSTTAILLSLITTSAAFSAHTNARTNFGRTRTISTTSTALNMADVSVAMIKELREATGAGMMDCKKALIEADGDAEAAADELRKKGLAKADKKSSRVAAEGRISIGKGEDGRTVMVEINCETDFVAKDANFLGFCEQVAGAASKVTDDDVESLMSSDIEDSSSGSSSSIEEVRTAMVAKIGENIQVRRMMGRGTADTVTGSYVHMNKIGVLVEIEGGDEQLAQDVAMHVAAMNPPYATKDDVPEEDLEKERAFLLDQVKDSGKPAEIAEKMVEGRLRKFLEEKCLVSQTYVKTNDKTVGELLKQSGASMVGFTRMAVGEGIEKKVDDFAAEVAAMAKGN